MQINVSRQVSASRVQALEQQLTGEFDSTVSRQSNFVLVAKQLESTLLTSIKL